MGNLIPLGFIQPAANSIQGHFVSFSWISNFTLSTVVECQSLTFNRL